VQRSVGLSVLILCGVAQADEPPSESTLLFEQGRALVKEGKHAEACPLFEKSMRLAPALGTELNLARCLAATGELARARTMFERLVAKLAETNQPERQALAQQGLDEVNARIPRVSIDTSALGSTEVTIDGAPHDAKQPIEVAPGPHEVRAKDAVPVRFEAVEGKVVEVVLARHVAPERPRYIYYVGGAAAGALLLTAIGGLVTLDKKSSGLDHCEETGTTLTCDQRGLDLLDSARTWSHVTTAAFLAGAGLAAATVYLELRWRKSKEAPVATAWADSSSVGVAVQCGF
jgi:hypothetical protein